MTGSLVRSHLSPAYPSRHSISRSTRNPLEDTAGASTSLVWPPQKFLSVFERTGLHRRGEVTPGYGGHWELDYWQSDTCFLSFERHTSSLPNPRRRRRHRSFQPSRAAPGGFLAPCRNVPAQRALGADTACQGGDPKPGGEGSVCWGRPVSAVVRAEGLLQSNQEAQRTPYFSTPTGTGKGGRGERTEGRTAEYGLQPTPGWNPLPSCIQPPQALFS